MSRAGHPLRGRSAAGFTLIEIMLVLVILGLIYSLAPPLFHKAFPALKLKAVTRDLVQEIRFVQQSAITTGQPTAMRFELSEDRYQSALINAGALRQLPEGFHFVHPPSNLAGQTLELHFYPDGSASGGQVQIGVDKRLYTIQVDWLTSQVEILSHKTQAEHASFRI
ncbi:MAG: prepilin-type N-terminal cleavage/methylation domain-containing protein [Candidatus Thiodiazotropha sp.]